MRFVNPYYLTQKVDEAEITPSKTMFVIKMSAAMEL